MVVAAACADAGGGENGATRLKPVVVLSKFPKIRLFKMDPSPFIFCPYLQN